VKITCEEAEEIRSLTSEKRDFKIDQFQAISLGATVELACFHVSQGSSAEELGAASMLSHRLVPLRRCLKAFRSKKPGPVTQPFVPLRYEFFPVTVEQVRGNDFYLFQERFKGAMRQKGFGSRFSSAICGAFFEMVDNVIQHSAVAGVPPASAIAGYHVANEQTTFAVGDTGRGVLESLAENPKWKNLCDSNEALLAIMRHHASRRPGMGDGEGFKQLLKTLADSNGWLRFRSMDAVCQIKGNRDGRDAFHGPSEFLRGFQITVTCSRHELEDGREEIPIDNLT
jgi:hypothetical protein